MCQLLMNFRAGSTSCQATRCQLAVELYVVHRVQEVSRILGQLVVDAIERHARGSSEHLLLVWVCGVEVERVLRRRGHPMVVATVRASPVHWQVLHFDPIAGELCRRTVCRHAVHFCSSGSFGSTT